VIPELKKIVDQAINSFKTDSKRSETFDKIKQKTVKIAEISKIIRECGQKMADIVGPETNLTV
jgi:chromosome segregation ATPase